MGDNKVYAVITDRAKRHIIVGQKAIVNTFGQASKFLQNMPNILGGTIDANETQLQAIIREIQEESGDLIDATGLTGLPNVLIPPENGNNKNGAYVMNFYQIDVSDLNIPPSDLNKKFNVGDNNWIKKNTATKYGQLEMAKTFAVDFSGMDPAKTSDNEIIDKLLQTMGLSGISAKDKADYLNTGTFKAIKAAFVAFPFP